MKTNRNQRIWIPVIILILTGLLLIGGVSASEFAPWSIQTVDSAGTVGQYSSVALDAAGNPAISYHDETDEDLKYASWNGSMWVITTVDASKKSIDHHSSWGWGRGWAGSWGWGCDAHYMKNYHGTGSVGEYTSLAFDSSGNPRISYYDDSNKDLKYAAWDGTQWVITTVDGTNYKKDGQKGYNWDGDNGRAQSSSINVGKYSSLVLDKNGNPRISYYDETHGILKYASWDGSKWVIKTVDASKSESDSRSYWGWGGYQNHDNDNEYIKYYHGTQKIGEYSSLALDSSGNPRISYHDEGNEDLKYASWNGTQWVISTVDGTNYKKAGQKGCNWDGDHGRDQYNSIKVGDYSSLALNSTGSPRISYYDETNKDLKYAAWDGSRWVITTVDSVKSVGEYPSLELNAKGDPRISYYDASNGHLKFAAWNRTNSLWVTEIVDNSKKVGTFTSLALNSQGMPCISYYDQSNKDLKYTGCTGHTQNPAPVANFVGTPTSGTAPLTVTFRDRSTNTPTSWGWDFGDNSSVNATVQNPVHTYASAGNYTVKLTATNSAGSNLFTQTNYITVTSGVVTPVVNFVGSPTSGTAPLTVTFTDSSTNTPISWSWDFGDNSSVNATVQNPVHTYASAGNYTVKLTATNSAGSNTKSSTNYIIVSPAIAAPTFVSAATNFDGTIITITFSKEMADPTGKADQFNFTINGGAYQIFSAAALNTDKTKIDLTTSNASIKYGDIIQVRYMEGDVVSSDGGVLKTFPKARLPDEPVSNNIPAPLALTFTSITPATGVAGTSVSITNLAGTGFLPGATVNLTKAGSSNITATSVTVDSSSKIITCTLPLPAPSATSAGQWNVVVTNTNGQSATLTNAFIVTNPAPTVTSINPATGVAGTQLSGVSITGENFVKDTTPSVWLAKQGEDIINTTDVVVVSPTQITCAILLTPYRNTLPGQWDLVVKNADGQSGSKIAAFALTNPAPVVTSIEPQTGVNGTTIQIVKVVGDNFGFGHNPDIWLAKTGQSNITASDTQISGTTQLKFTLIIPETAPAGKWDLMVRSKDGQTGAYLGYFEITPKVGATPLTWDWSVNGWDGWQPNTICPTTGTCSIYGPVMVNGHGEYGSDITSALGSKTESSVWKTFTAPSDTTWTSLTFTGLLSSSDLLNGRKMTINVDGVDVYSDTAGHDPTINGQQFTITKTFTQRNAVKVTISGIQNPIKTTSSYRMQFNSLTLS